MKPYAPEFAGMYVWATADPKSSKASYAPSKSTNAPPNAVHGHPIGRFDSDGCYWTFIPMTGNEDPTSPLSSKFVKHPLADQEMQAAIKAKVWGSLNSFGSYKETEF
jgi:hypothetical protein